MPWSWSLRAAGCDIPYDQNGDVRADAGGHEHFGFDDGVSQPGIRGRASDASDDNVADRCIDPSSTPEHWLFGRPGQNLVWPGEFILGYPASSPDPLLPGPIAGATPAWANDGSFLVFRRLAQNVGLFWSTIKRRCPSTTSPLLRTRQGILKPNSRIEEHMRSTAPSFLRGLRAYSTSRSIRHISICCVGRCGSQISPSLPCNSSCGFHSSTEKLL
jgi:hypothetical protein